MSSHCGAGQPLVSSSSHIIGRKRDHWSFSASDTGRRWCQWGLHLPSWAIAGLTSTLVSSHHSLLWKWGYAHLPRKYSIYVFIYVYVFNWYSWLNDGILWSLITLLFIVNTHFNGIQVLLSSVPKTPSELDINYIIWLCENEIWGDCLQV